MEEIMAIFICLSIYLFVYLCIYLFIPKVIGKPSVEQYIFNKFLDE